MPHPLGTRPGKVVAVHLNYRGRAAERGRIPDQPSYFLKPATSLAGSGDPLLRPRGCELMGFEGEIALVIGERAYQVPPQRAWEHVAWVTAANDAGVYDLRYADRGSNLRSKGSDGFTPIGPRLLDARTIEPDALRLRTWVNGELVQDDTSDTLLFDFARLVADLSRTITLEPGDVILTGTPSGASVVEPGDVVEIEVTGGAQSTGRLTNTVVEADSALAGYGAMPQVLAEDKAAAFGVAVVPTLTVERRAALTGISVATLASQLRKRGFNGFFVDGVRPTRPELKMVGTARTLRYLPLREDLFARYGAGMNAQKRAIESVLPGEVLVMDARREADAGTLGDILALRALKRGAAGIVTDGGLRDSAAVSGLDLPVYSSSVHVAVLGRKHVPWDTDVPIACGNTLVQPGDVLVGDADGVIVLPPHLLDELITDAREQELQEAFITEQVAAGASVAGLYPLGPDWQSAYRAWLDQRIDNRMESPA
ncbi:fumarylacetoacetate hydrolase family protein [Catenulispora sp. NL8]|uniref:Fumarylacetoacetate hydrolase family protein n=1 Tax=Catenulispora pinistramenti TaxID=2705254 RepID=A0ABS5L294_9ACTN|nr:fumarylacetoacetate hydrolase family protein [Catenulispora pinistramenti]MBS2552370.1 fumarylacetoacetate hydrolase family protein [Catenulispora pinistramenti]